MIVMMMAITPSLNASIRFVPIFVLSRASSFCRWGPSSGAQVLAFEVEESVSV
jgi:hypothetical protein